MVPPHSAGREAWRYRGLDPRPNLNEVLNLTSPMLDLTNYRTRLLATFIRSPLS